MKRLGYLQRHMLDYCKRYPGPHYVGPDSEAVRIARSLEKRNLLYVVDCGMTDCRGRTVLMVRADF
jgi:hypothetical protein